MVLALAKEKDTAVESIRNAGQQWQRIKVERLGVRLGCLLTQNGVKRPDVGGRECRKEKWLDGTCRRFPERGSSTRESLSAERNGK